MGLLSIWGEVLCVELFLVPILGGKISFPSNYFSDYKGYSTIKNTPKVLPQYKVSQEQKTLEYRVNRGKIGLSGGGT